jgi:electron transport complex protein RnfE
MPDDGPTSLERFVRGMCPTLAVTNGMREAMTMAGAVTFVLVCANVIISLIRHLLKPHLRILVFTLTIATFVTIADRFLAAFLPVMSARLGPYVPLIIVNCIIICRCEVCASKQSLAVAAGDAIGQSIGFALALTSIATVREVLGSGTWFGLPLLPEAAWPRWGIMLLPAGAFLTLGLLLGAANKIGQWASRGARRG